MRKSNEIICRCFVVKCDDPKANALLQSANKWLRRLDERRADLPKSLFRDGDPAPLRKQITEFLASP